MNGENIFIPRACTRMDYHKYWCPVASNSPQEQSLNGHPVHLKISEGKYKWGECALSCMETYNKTSVLMTGALSPDLISHLTFAGKLKQFFHEFTFKGYLSDIYIWKR